MCITALKGFVVYANAPVCHWAYSDGPGRGRSSCVACMCIPILLSTSLLNPLLIVLRFVESLDG